MDTTRLPAMDSVGEWLFDDNDTTNAIADTSGNGYNGTNNGGTFTSDTPLGTGHSLNFFGGNNYAWVTTGGNETVFSGGDAFTVAIWYKKLPDNDWESLISKRGESNGGWKIAKMSSADLYFYNRGTAGGMEPRTTNASTSITPADNDWHHVAVVHGYQGVKQRMYFDGVLIDEQSRSGTTQASNGMVLGFGVRDDGTTNGALQAGGIAKTHIDDARYYNRALEGYEITAMTIRSNKLVAYVDTPYSYQIPATQGPTSWTTNGTLASKGLSLSNTGLVSGTPNAAGEFSFPITVANSEGNMTRTYQMNVKKGTRDLTWGQTIAGLTYGDANFTLSATSTNSGGITYASSDESIVEINGTSKTQHTLEDGLVWYWNFDDDQNGSSNPVNATIGGMNGTKGSGVTLVNGKFGNALSFDGSNNNNSKVDFGANSRTNFDGVFSVSFWVKRTGGYSGYGRIITNKSGTNNPGFHIYFSTTNDRLYTRGTTQSRYSRPTSSWNSQNWVHVVNTYNAESSTTSGRWKMYGDGVFLTQNNIPKIEPGTANLFFGRSPGGGNRMIGELDDVRFYDRVLSGAEVSTLYGSGNGDFVTVRTGNEASIKKAGSVTLTGYAPGTTNMFGATPITKTVTVSKASLTVTGDDFSINVGNAMPTLTSQTTGWKNGDTNASLSTQVSVTTDASNSNTAGTFYVRPGGAASDKYVFTYVDGQLVVTNKTPQSISWGQNFSSAAINQIIDLNASASSSLPVTYAVSDTSKAELAVTLQSNLDSWWKLDETSATTIADSSGSGSSSHTAVLIGTDGSNNWSAGKFGNALTLDGTNDYAFTSGYKGITGTTRRTLSLWFKTSTANKPILQYGAAGTGTLFKVSINGSGVAVVDLGNVTITGGSGLANGAWHHLAVSVPESGNSGGVKLYINGSASSGSGSTAVNTNAANDLKIGTDGSAYFNGQLDDVRLYNAELNSTVVGQIYGSGTGDFNRLQLKAAGSFTLTASQAGNGTYAVAPDVTTTLNIGKLSQNIAFSPITDKSIGDFDFDPGATASSSLPVTYTSSAPLIASVEGTTAGSQKIKVRAAGQVTITASQAGDTAYNAAPDANQTFTVGYYNLFADSLPGLKLWLDGNSVDSDHSSADIITNGTTIGSWKDRSASTNHATQGTSANRPTYTLNGLNSKGVLSYTAGQSSDISADSTIRSIFAVIKQASSQTAETQPFGGNIAGTTSAGKFGLKRTGSSMLDSGITSQSFAVVTWQMASGNYAVYINGEERVTGTDPNAPAAFTKIGNNFAGQIAEIVAYNAAMNTSVREKLEGYLGHKWGLNTSFPTSHTYKVAKPAFGGTQNLNFQTLPDRQTGQTVTLSVTADSGLSTFSYDSNDTNVVSFSGDVATALAVGKVRITATQAGNSNWLSANAYQDWIVTATPRSDQNITFAAIPNKNALSANFDLNATASSSLPVSFTSQTPNIATVDGNGTVTIKSTGVATFRASQDGNGSYNAAPTVDQTLTITKVPQTITFGSISNQNLSAGTYSLSATASSNLGVSFVSSNTSLGSVSGNVVTLVAGGTITITASQGGDSTYDAAPTVNQNLTIIDDTLTAQTITWSQSLSSLSYGTPDTNMTASASSGLAITYISSDSNVVDVNGSFLKIIGAGTATVSASQGGNGEYSAASTVDKNVTVSKANQTIVAANNATTLPNITKDSGDFEFSPGSKSVKTGTTTSTGLAVSYASSNTNVILVTSSGTRLKPVGGGTSTITVTQAGDSGYNVATSKSFTVTVTEFSPYSNSLPGMIFWLNAYDVNGDGSPDANSDFTSIGGKVQPSGWADVSGNSASFSQSSTSVQPVYVVQGGKPGLAFGSSQGNNGAHLTGSVPSTVSGNVGYTLVIAAKTSGTGGNRFFHLGATSGAAGQLIGHGKNGGYYFNGGGEQTFSGVNFGGNVQVGVFRRKAGSTYADSEFILNGTKKIGTAISGTSTPNIPSSGRDMILGAGRNASGAIAQQLDNGVIHEVMLFEGDLNDFAVRRLEGYLAYKWGSNARLANGHPFGSSRPLFGGSQSITVAATNVPLDAADSNKPFMSTFDDPFVLEGAYATSGLNIVYETNNSSVIAVNSSGMLNPVGTGLVRVTLKQPGDSHFSAASNQTFDMKIIGKRPQTLTFTTVNETRIDQAMDLNGTSSAGLAVTFSVTAGGSIANLSNNRLTFTGTGSVTVRASQAGNGTYAAAVAVDQTFLVKRPLTLVFDAIGDMGRNQQFVVKAVVLDGISNQAVQVTPTYSIISGPATISGGQITCGNTTGNCSGPGRGNRSRVLHHHRNGVL
ncbi:MAG: LamG-like jellyroll fold domain-containing protein [Opitutales bacterium]